MKPGFQGGKQKKGREVTRRKGLQETLKLNLCRLKNLPKKIVPMCEVTALKWEIARAGAGGGG
jgi:hypothetical protein